MPTHTVLPGPPARGTSTRTASFTPADRVSSPRHLLVAADGRADPRPAIGIAASLAARLDTSVEVLAALEPTPTYGGAAASAEVARLERERLAAVHAAMRRRIGEGAPRGAERPVHVVLGSPTTALAEWAARHEAELVVVGTGWDATSGAVLGVECALGVAGMGRVPVLATGRAADGIVRRAVVGVDFGPASVRAAALACRLLSPGGTLSLVYVKPALELGGAGSAAWSDACERQLAELFRRLAAALRTGGVAPVARGGRVVDGEGVACDGRRDVTVGAATLVGDAADELAAYARHVGADLVGLGTHAAPRVESDRVGRVTADVARRVAARLPATGVLLAP